jgi:lauroyl/myristoyl acyltransferase
MNRVFYHVGLFRAAQAIARQLPRPALHSLARAVGRVGYWKNPSGRAALQSNLQRITEHRERAFDALCHRNVRFFSEMLADYFLCTGNPEHAGTLVESWIGIEHLDAARSRGKGVIVVTGHLGNWELGATILAGLGLPMSIITLAEPSNELSRWREAHRQKLGIKTITVGPGHDFAFVEMIQTLRRNELVAMLVDRPYEGSGSLVDFFGAPAPFSNGPALLWQHTGAAVVPAFVLRNERGGYRSLVAPIIELEHAPDPRESLRKNTQRIAAYFETVIQQHPEQWFNYVPIWNS